MQKVCSSCNKTRAKRSSFSRRGTSKEPNLNTAAWLKETRGASAPWPPPLGEGGGMNEARRSPTTSYQPPAHVLKPQPRRYGCWAELGLQGHRSFIKPQELRPVC